MIRGLSPWAGALSTACHGHQVPARQVPCSRFRSGLMSIWCLGSFLPLQHEPCVLGSFGLLGTDHWMKMFFSCCFCWVVDYGSILPCVSSPWSLALSREAVLQDRSKGGLMKTVVLVVV